MKHFGVECAPAAADHKPRKLPAHIPRVSLFIALRNTQDPNHEPHGDPRCSQPTLSMYVARRVLASDYIIASIELYLDVVNLFRYLLMLLVFSSSRD